MGEIAECAGRTKGAALLCGATVNLRVGPEAREKRRQAARSPKAGATLGAAILLIHWNHFQSNARRFAPPEFPLPRIPGVQLSRRIKCRGSSSRRAVGPAAQIPSPMADIKFRCPECTQKIAVIETAVGAKIDCPTCHSRLVIPRSATAPVEVLVARKLAIVGGTADAVYAELQKAQEQAEHAADEIKRLRADSVTAAQGAQAKLAAITAARDSLTAEVASLRPLREQIDKVQKEVGALRERGAQLEGAQKSEAALRAEVEKLKAEHAAATKRVSEFTAQLASAQSEREKFAAAGKEIAGLREELGKAQSERAALSERAAQLESSQKSEAALRAEVEKLKAEHAAATNRISEITGQLAAVQLERDEFSVAGEEVAGLRDELAMARRDATSAQRTLATMEEAQRFQLDAARGVEAGVRAELSGLQSRFAQAEARLGSQAEQISELKDKNSRLAADLGAMESLQQQLTGTQEDFARMRDQAASAARDHQAQLENVRGSESDLRASLDDLQNRHMEAEGRVAEQALLLADLDRRNSELKNVEGEVTELREKLAGTDRQLNQAREHEAHATAERDDALARAHGAETAQRDKMTAVESQLSESERRIAALTHGFNALKQERQDLVASLEAARAERDENAAVAARHHELLEQLATAMDAANGELRQLRDDAKKAEADKSRMVAELEKFSADKHELLEFSKGVDAEVEKAREENGRLKELIESAESAARAKDEQIQKQSETAAAAASKKDEQIQQLTAKSDSLAGLLAQEKKAASDAIKKGEESRAEIRTAQERLRDLTRAEAEAREQIKTLTTEKTGLAEELARRATEIKALISEREVLKGEIAGGRSDGPKGKGAEQKKQSAGAFKPDREKTLEAECDALKAEIAGLKPALERAKQHVGVLQTRRDMLRDEVSSLRKRLGLSGEVASENEKPIAK